MLPWQRLVADVAGERFPADHDRAGEFAYDEVIVLVGRRGGKTRLTHGVALRRGLHALRAPIYHPQTRLRVPYLAASTAQNMTAATRRLRETWDAFRRAAPAAAQASRLLTGVNHAAVELAYRRRSAGRWESNPWASRLRVFPPTADALRGDEFLMVAVDEALVLTPDDGVKLVDAGRPTMATFAGHAQWYWLSNEGANPGGYLGELKARGRAAVDAGSTTGTAYFEWSMADDADPEDPATWRRVHPALGHVLTESALARELVVMGPESFAREYLNRESRAGVLWVIDPAAWDACRDTAAQHGPAVTLGIAVTPDRTRSAIGAASITRDGRTFLELVEIREGVAWLAGRARELARTHHALIAYDATGPAGGIGDTLTATKRAPTRPLGVRHYSDACETVVDRVRAGRAAHLGQPALDAAVRTVTARRIGESWAFARAGDTVALEAVTCAVAAVRAETPRPRIRAAGTG